jgi:hypothetical protein
MASTDQPTVRAHCDSTTVGPRLAMAAAAAFDFATLDSRALVLPVSGNAHGWPLVVGATVTLLDQDATDLVDGLVAMLVNELAGVCGHDASGRPS